MAVTSSRLGLITQGHAPFLVCAGRRKDAAVFQTTALGCTPGW
jgi:hypothetical protein